MYGNKIDNLVILKDNYINVPDFIIIKHEDIVKDNSKFNTVLKNYKNLNSHDLSLKLKKIFDEEINIEFNCNIEEGLYSVRSSSNIEDGNKNSFAGQFETFLNVKREEINDKIKLCFKSLYNENVLEYIKNNNIEFKELKMNVMIQKMVNSELSGVIFTANPKGILNETVITVGEGVGENIVQDKVDTTSYYYNLTDKIYYYEGKKDYLKKEIVEELINQSIEIKKYFGEYLDIEFAIYENVIYILQARKITTINDSNPLILDNSNIVESYPGISLPLTCSFVNIIYTGVFRGISYRILKDKKAIERYEDVFSNMVGNVNGRLYYKISNWYTLLKFLPLNSKIIPVWQEMLGVKNKNYNNQKVKLSIKTKIMTYFNYIYEFLNVQKSMESLNKEFIEVNTYFYNNYSKDKSEKELVELYYEVKNRLLNFWDITLINDMYSFLYTGLLKHRLKKQDEDYEKIANQYISGITNIESMKPIKELIKLAYEKDNISNQKYNQRIDEYIKLYGDRNLEELKIESSTYRTDRNLLENKIEEYNTDKEHLKNIFESINGQALVSREVQDKSVQKIIDKCKQGIKNREISRLNRSRIFGMVREIFITLGEKFADKNVIDDPKDIYYLTVQEIFELVENKKSMQQVIEKRKSDYEMYKLLPTYSRLIFEEKEFNKSHINVNSNKIYKNDNTLKGIPCSNGIVEGEALVINDINNVPNCNGKILITKMTDPGWVFLLATAKGIIAEKGSLLSHTAIISRELKIPSIVGVEDLLDTIKNGDRIKMNGFTGEIEILERTNEWNIENSNMKVTR